MLPPGSPTEKIPLLPAFCINLEIFGYLTAGNLLKSSSKPNGILVTTERIVRMVRTNSIACGATASSAYAQQLKPMPEPDACGGIDYDT